MAPSGPPLGPWVLAVTAAGLAGFVVVAATGAATGGRPGAMVTAGAVEGLLLGAGQVVGAGRGVLPFARWSAASAVGAAIAWALGMVPGAATLRWTDPPVVVAVVVGAAVALGAMPVLQWAATGFRRGLAGWVAVSAGAWAVGLLWAVLPSPFVDQRADTVVLVTAYAAAGLLTATTVALLTGLGVRRLPGFEVPAGGPEGSHSAPRLAEAPAGQDPENPADRPMANRQGSHAGDVIGPPSGAPRLVSKQFLRSEAQWGGRHGRRRDLVPGRTASGAGPPDQ